MVLDERKCSSRYESFIGVAKASFKTFISETYSLEPVVQNALRFIDFSIFQYFKNSFTVWDNCMKLGIFIGLEKKLRRVS